MEAIKYYVKGAFLGIAETPSVLEQQEELIADLSAKVEDLVSEGKPEEEALGIAIASMGDLSGLVREFAAEESASSPSKQAPQVTVYAHRLRLHAVLLSGIACIMLIAPASVLGTLALGTALYLLLGFFLCVGFGIWAAYVLLRFHKDPHATATVEQSWKVLFRTLSYWAVACAGAFFLNILENMSGGGQGFWSWMVWLAALVWPGAILAEQILIRLGKFIYPKPEVADKVNSGTPAASGTLAMQ